MNKSRALLFGLNYDGTNAKLNGCINDVMNMKEFLTSKYRIPCTVYTDDVDKVNTSAAGIMANLNKMAILTYTEELDFVWIHYSGHGSQSLDRSRDERDGRDECIVPNNYEKAGLISDDYINKILSLFNPKTRVICVFDCCHSGTVSDLKYSWEKRNIMAIENVRSMVRGKVLSISGCLDKQVAMDAFNVTGDFKFTGALTSCLLTVFKEDAQYNSVANNVFDLLEKLRIKLKTLGFQQIPMLCSSYNLAIDCIFIPKTLN